MQYTVLQAALILTITVNLYINPPALNSELNLRIFSAIIGFAAFSHVSVIVSSTILSGQFNMVYSEADALRIRIESNARFMVTTILNYVAIVATVAGMLVAGFDRSPVDGALQLYSLPLLALLLFHFLSSNTRGTIAQDQRSFLFYKKYCDANGELTDHSLAMVYPPAPAAD
jgi:hypothetical protein